MCLPWPIPFSLKKMYNRNLEWQFTSRYQSGQVATNLNETYGIQTPHARKDKEAHAQYPSWQLHVGVHIKQFWKGRHLLSSSLYTINFKSANSFGGKGNWRLSSASSYIWLELLEWQSTTQLEIEAWCVGLIYANGFSGTKLTERWHDLTQNHPCIGNWHDRRELYLVSCFECQLESDHYL